MFQSADGLENCWGPAHAIDYCYSSGDITSLETVDILRRGGGENLVALDFDWCLPVKNFKTEVR